MVCVSSTAGHVAALGREDEAALATAPAEHLLGLAAVQAVGDSATRAYVVLKRADQVRVEAAALAWSRRAHAVHAGGERRGPHRHPGGDSGRRGLPHRPRSALHHRQDLLVDGGQAAWLQHHWPA
jgi:hypothetical protein